MTQRGKTIAAETKKLAVDLVTVVVGALKTLPSSPKTWRSCSRKSGWRCGVSSSRPALTRRGVRKYQASTPSVRRVARNPAPRVRVIGSPLSLKRPSSSQT
ncbi:MAG: hypothetical protein HC897_13165 [Thermoanaerobaculia bacterium]|nr:hypothetical protein [Thermoanaerobaculia bacterium]